MDHVTAYIFHIVNTICMSILMYNDNNKMARPYLKFQGKKLQVQPFSFEQKEGKRWEGDLNNKEKV